jgi:pyruvate/2-oxoglutarate dehydrogenase complex dihydrolipoamide dehydrogenase (E3) component
MTWEQPRRTIAATGIVLSNGISLTVGRGARGCRAAKNEQANEEEMSFGAVGVIGAGVMGVGVGQDLAQTGHQVILIDISDEILDQAEEQIRKNAWRRRGLNDRTSRKSWSASVFRRITVCSPTPSS